MFKKSHLSIAVGAALGISSIASLPAYALEDTTLEEVVVTGTRIQKTNLISSSPVTQVDAEELLFQGTVRVEDMLRNLPQRICHGSLFFWDYRKQLLAISPEP